MTLRQDLVATAVSECIVRNMKPSNVTLAGWLETSNAAKSVAVEHGVPSGTVLGDEFNFLRFVAEVARKFDKERKRLDWLRALRGEE